MKILNALIIFPVNDMDKTAEFYVEKLGFRCVKYLDAAQPHVCLYRDAIEIVLTKAEAEVIPNRKRYGYGEDAYLITVEQESLQEEFRARGVPLVKEVSMTDYGNKEFMMQLGTDPKEIAIMMDYNTKRVVTLKELCPEWPGL